jgi:hypothetical protein
MVFCFHSQAGWHRVGVLDLYGNGTWFEFELCYVPVAINIKAVTCPLLTSN